MRLVGHTRSRAPRATTSAAIAALVLLVASLLPTATAGPLAPAAASAAPASVTIAGSLQSELGCPGDWQPDCAATHLTYDAADDAWQGTFIVPAGAWEYKVALNDGWAENYGANAQPGGANITLTLAAPTTVRFYYSDTSHWVADDVGSVIATAPGSFQSELGCPGDWQPDCLRSWLQDPDGDGTYTFETTALPAGSYEAKVAIDESWDVNYGQGGVQNGPNIGFTVPANNAKVTFSYDAASHVLSIQAGHGLDNNVEWAGLRHDSRDLLYRTPGGAVPAGTDVTLRFRTFHGDVSGVKVRWYSVNLGGQQIVPMTLAASAVGCYEPGLEAETCDFWQTTLASDKPGPGPDNLWYRFIVTDGTKTVYYADDTSALDGGLGAASDTPIDDSWALMRYVPGFTAPAWAKDAVIYQIFPDRFRNGRKDNDPKTGDVRYDDPVLRLPSWATLPEGYCRNYADGATDCPWRFDTTPPADSPTKEQPRGRDYAGGDLKGIDQQLDYLRSVGITTIYLNPIFDAGSNHAYDTQDYTKVDPSFGTQKDWENLVKHAQQRGMRIVLDGVFNHMSSDSPFFDRYGHYPQVGACESVTSTWRSWFTFRPQAGGPCAGPGGPNTMTYDGWFGFDSIPVLDKSNPAVQAYFLTNPDSISRTWLQEGASGWRLDVSGDASFPADYWPTFRSVVKGTDPNALTISETWQKDSTLLRMLRGDRLDTTMNYRLRDAVIGLLAPGSFDSKGFPASGNPITPTQFANRLASIREDYPDAAYYALMNLLDSHDTERLLWTLTPGTETRADKEQNASNVAAGKQGVRLASLVQFTVPGAPTIYYGDEVGMTGDDDPDDRRTYPWPDLGGSPDTSLRGHYQALIGLRTSTPALTDGDFRVLSTNDADGTVAYGRKTGSQAAVVVMDRSGAPATVTVPLAGYVPDGTALTVRFGVDVPSGGTYVVSGGTISVPLPAKGAAVLATELIDLTPPSAPTALAVTGEAANQVSLSWDVVPGAAGYDVFASPVTGGGYVKVNTSPVTDTSFTATGLQNSRLHYFVVRALDAAGNASGPSNEVSGVPHVVIGWANLQWPPTIDHVISATSRTSNVYGQVWIDGVTNQPGATPDLRAQLGSGPRGSDPTSVSWTWVDAAFHVDAGNNDEFVASLLPEAVGDYDYVYRYTVTAGRDWLYADLNGPIPGGALPPNPGRLTVLSSGDTTPPDVPTGLTVTSASPAGIALAWDAVAGDPTLYGYEVGRSEVAGGPYVTIATVSGSESYTDTTVAEGATYSYVVRSVDTSFNRSGDSAEVTATAQLRTVTVVFDVTVPASTDATGRAVYIAGFLDRLDGNLPQWNPGGVVLTRVDATHWTITLTGKESTQIEYKYALGSWDYVEKDAGCGEISNRQLTLAYGTTGTQQVNDTVQNWRNVSPCGN